MENIVTDRNQTYRRKVDRFLSGLAVDLSKTDDDTGLAAADLLKRFRAGETVVMFIGEVNKGKSSLINALLAENVLPSGPWSTSRLLCSVKHGEQFKITLDDSGDEISPEQLENLARAHDSEADVLNSLVTVTIELPSERLKDGLVLVDTPGVNDMSLQKEEILYQRLPAADKVVMVFDCRYVLTASEVAFLADGVPGPARANLVLALTKADRLNAAEREEVMEWCAEGLDSIGFDAPFLLVSARDGTGIGQLRGMLGGLPGQGGIADQCLTRAGLLLERAADCLAVRRQALGSDGPELEKRAVKLAEESKRRRSEAARFIEEFSLDVTDILEKLLADLRLFAIDFKEAVPASIEGVAAEDVRRYLPFFIRDTFEDWIKNALKEAENSLKQSAEKASGRIKRGVDGLRRAAGFSVDDDTARQGVDVKLALKCGLSQYDIGVAILSLIGGVALFVNLVAGGLITAAAAGAAMGFRKNRDEDILLQALEQAPLAVDETKKRIEDLLVEEFGRYKGETSAQLWKLFETEASRLERSLENAARLAREHSDMLEKEKEICDALDRMLREKELDLLELRREAAPDCC